MIHWIVNQQRLQEEPLLISVLKLLFNRTKKDEASLITADKKLYVVECDITFNNKVVKKQKFTIYAINGAAAKTEIIKTVKITPKKAHYQRKK